MNLKSNLRMSNKKVNKYKIRMRLNLKMKFLKIYLNKMSKYAQKTKKSKKNQLSKQKKKSKPCKQLKVKKERRENS